MKNIKNFYFIILIISGIAAGSCTKEADNPVESKQAANTILNKTELYQVTPFVKDLNYPRGLKFGPDGMLYISESGLGGKDSTVGQCEQVPSPVGPYLGGMTGRISRADMQGNRTTLADSLPSTQAAPALGAAKTSIGDVAFVNNSLYALLSGAGCSHGHPEIPNGILKFNQDNSWKLMGDISSFLKSNPVAKPEADDFEPDGTPYSMIVVDNAIYFIEPNHGELDKFDPSTNQITRIIDISKTQGHIVPTALAYKDGFFYVGNLTTSPFKRGSAKIFKINKDGSSICEYLTGFTTILGLQFDNSGRLYVLETNTSLDGPPFFNPNSGRIKRVDNSCTYTEIAKELNFPTAMTFGPDGNLYVSVNGFGAAPGSGEVVKVNITSSSLVRNNSLRADGMTAAH